MSTYVAVCDKMFSCFRTEPIVYPKHIAVIPDGNRRYARRAFQDAGSSHEHTGKAMQCLIDWCLDKGIGELSIFAWSSENWTRPQEEIDSTMEQILRVLSKWMTSEQTDIAFYFVSTSAHKLNRQIQQKMRDLTDITRNHKKLKCYIYVSYGFSEDVEQAQRGDFRDLSKVPSSATDPDLLIRTSGEYRLSNFCMWHLRYTELLFIQPLFPECDAEVWDDCAVQYSGRQRRYGK